MGEGIFRDCCTKRATACTDVLASSCVQSTDAVVKLKNYIHTPVQDIDYRNKNQEKADPCWISYSRTGAFYLYYYYDYDYYYYYYHHHYYTVAPSKIATAEVLKGVYEDSLCRRTCFPPSTILPQAARTEVKQETNWKHGRNGNPTAETTRRNR